MKKILLMCLVLISAVFTSCTSTGYCVSANKLNEQLEKIAEDYNNEGFMYVGKNTNSQNNLYVAGYNYNKYSGYESVLANNMIYKDTYVFKNEGGNTVRFTVQYQVQCEGGLSNVSICECETDNSNLYNKLCNNSSLNSINHLPNSYKYEYYDSAKTYLLVAGICCLPLIFLIPMMTK